MRKMHDRHPALPDQLEQPVAASENARCQYHEGIGPWASLPPYASPRDRA